VDVNAILILCFIFQLLLCVCTWKDGVEDLSYSLLYLPDGHLCVNGNVGLYLSSVMLENSKSML
jgi:hypothetical protein